MITTAFRNSRSCRAGALVALALLFAPIAVFAQAPSIDSINVSSATIDENGSVTVDGSWSDPQLPGGMYMGTASWSDGASSAVTLDTIAGTFSTSRQILDDDPTGTSSDSYFVTITITDDDLNQDMQVSPDITVNNVAPSIDMIEVSPMAIDPGETVTVSGTYSDDGTLDTHDIQAFWDDGQMQSPTAAGGSFSFMRMFAADYAGPTPLTVQIVLTDDDGGVDIQSSPSLTVPVELQLFDVE